MVRIVINGKLTLVRNTKREAVQAVKTLYPSSILRLKGNGRTYAVQADLD